MCRLSQRQSVNWKICLGSLTWDPPQGNRPGRKVMRTTRSTSGSPDSRKNGRLPERWSRDHSLPRTRFYLNSYCHSLGLTASDVETQPSVPQKGHRRSLQPWSEKPELCQEGQRWTRSKMSVCGDTQWQLPLQGTDSLRKSTRCHSLSYAAHRFRKCHSSCLCQLPNYGSRRSLSSDMWMEQSGRAGE